MIPRRSLLTVLVAGSTLALAACSDSENAPDAERTAAGDAGGGTFPATVETALGAITVDQAPQRVVALGWGDAETALALGVEPVGASDWLAFGGEGVGPWAEGLYSEAPTIIETLEPSYEAIAALKPDLILDVKSSGEQDRYDRLSQIAPTIGVPEGGENYLTTPEQQLTMIAQALGVPDAAQALQEEVDCAIPGGRVRARGLGRGRRSPRPRAAPRAGAPTSTGPSAWSSFERLGFVLSPKIAELPASATGFSVDISAEQLDLYDADLIVAFPIYLDATEISEDPQWQQIPAVADGRALVLGGDLSSAYSLGSVLSTKFAVEKMVPLLEETLDA